jgi:translation initiation factor 5B
VVGHVDTGKTALLDAISQAVIRYAQPGDIVQFREFLFVPKAMLDQQFDKVKYYSPFHLNLPGLLIVDTPGNQSVSNVNSIALHCCDIAILVIDIWHGLENQTIEALKIISRLGKPFVIALNKIDRLWNWNS